MVERKLYSMLGFALRKKIDENKLANIFVNSLIEVVENSYSEVVDMIKEDPAFVSAPDINATKWNHFLLITTVGNLEFLKSSFDDYNVDSIESKIIERFAQIFDMTPSKFSNFLEETREFIDQHNFPSKNILYGMSKAVFYRLDLNQYQESYFKSMNTANPLFLKRMDDVITNFMWDWDVFLKKFKM